MASNRVECHASTIVHRVQPSRAHGVSRCPVLHISCGSIQGDVGSFGVFLLEIRTWYALPRQSDIEPWSQDVVLSWCVYTPPLFFPREPCCCPSSTCSSAPLFVPTHDHELSYKTANVSPDMSTSNPATPVTAETPSGAVPLVSEKKAHSESSDHSESKYVAPITDPTVLAAREEAEIEAAKERKHRTYLRIRPFILCGLALLILGWWISATILPATRPRWCVPPFRYCRFADIGLCSSIRIVQTIWAWFFILVIAFRYIPNSVVTKPVGAVWGPVISKPFFKLPWGVRLALGWAVLLAIVFGSAFGFPLPSVGLLSYHRLYASLISNYPRGLAMVTVLSPSSVSSSSKFVSIFPLYTRSIYPGTFAYSGWLRKH